MNPAGIVTVLYSFGASAVDGTTPSAPLIQGKDGALYGTTSSGGTFGAGTVFKITMDGTYTLLYSFGASPTDGLTPVAALLEGADGNFYGTTASGGANHCVQSPQSGGNCGTVFKITSDGIETVVYSFGSSVADGVEPTAALIQTADGAFYGTTLVGGANSCSTTGETNDCGTVFKISPTGVETVLHSFGETLADAVAPQGPLTIGADGALYGTSASGGGGLCGGSFGCGTVYRITPDGAESILFAFASRANGFGPAPSLLQAPNGDFYGTTDGGGMFEGDLDGTAFVLSSSGVHTVLYSFGPLNTNPSDPIEGLTLGKDGAFYGIASESPSLGTSANVFKMTVN